MPFCNGMDTDCNIIRLERVQTSRMVSDCERVWRTFFTEKANDGGWKPTGATLGLDNQWKAINWQKVEAEVKKAANAYCKGSAGRGKC